MGKSGSLLKLNRLHFLYFFTTVKPQHFFISLLSSPSGKCIRKANHSLPSYWQEVQTTKAPTFVQEQSLLQALPPRHHGTPKPLYPPFSNYFLTYLELALLPPKVLHSVNGKYFYIFVCLCITSSVMTYELNLACIWRRDIHPVWMKLSKYLQRLFGPYLVQ